MPLSRDTLDNMPSRVAVPGYAVAEVRLGIVHLGLGGFHRAHMARYTHELMNCDPAALRWGIVGAGLRAEDRPLHAALETQDRLYTLIERDGAGERAVVIGSLCGLAMADEDATALLDLIDDGRIRIVSLTVTEQGYCLDAATKRLDVAHPMIAADLRDPRRPHSAIGIVAEACRRRMARGGNGFTALSCDNIQHNGDVLAAAVLDYAALIASALADWIGTKISFPNSMVDRITPLTRPDDIAHVATAYDIADAAPVCSETFSQWIIEDDFADGRPAWEMGGAQFVADVTPYEQMKLRLLNASHLAISGPARLIGYATIDEGMRDDRLCRYMRALMDRETEPTLAPVPGVDLPAYKAELIERFANPTIRDSVERVNNDAPLNYLLDPIRDRLACGQSVDFLAFAVAAWLRRMRGEDERGAVIDVRHPLAAVLREAAIAGEGDPMPMLRIASLFGELSGKVAFSEVVGRWLASLYAVGAQATLDVAAHELDF